MATKRSASSPRERRLPASALFTHPLSDRDRKQLEKLAKMPDSEIDESDIPEMRSFPRQVYIGRFYKPVKEQISLRIDADVLAWFRSKGKKYQTYMNQVLRREMQETRGRIRVRTKNGLRVLDVPDNFPVVTTKQVRQLLDED